MSRIGQAVKEARRERMTSRDLAERITLTPQYIRLIECGGAIPAMETVLKIANIFPDVDSAAWLWLLLEDVWGPAVVTTMRRHALAAPTPEEADA